MPFVLACFQVTAAPWLEKSDREKNALFGIDGQITTYLLVCPIYNM
jgi:hypothetical protein